MKSHPSTVDHDQELVPWYKQFWPWLIISIPAATVVAGIITIIIATNSADSLIKEDYYKEGLAINQSKERQQHAQQLNLSFQLRYTNQQLHLTALTPLDIPRLYLLLQHPVDESKDLIILLNRQASSTLYQSGDLQLAAVNYRLTLYPDDKQWEILFLFHGSPNQNPVVQTCHMNAFSKVKGPSGP